jgi:sterol desaturase/sphingolipid hydroxylase (fatty acid hydroxylase superfamily)
MLFLKQIIFEHFMVHWGICLLCLFFDYLSGEKFKVHRQNIPDTWRNIFFRVLFNQIFVALPCFYFLNNFSEESLYCWRNLYKIPLTFLYEDILFYYVHRLLHVSYFYEKIHKIHHRWTVPICISAIYAHPLEHLFANILPVILSARLAGLGQDAMRLWGAFTLINTLVFAHGGYKIGHYKNMHDRHHTDFNCNYGAVGIMDKLHGTLR